MNKFLRTALVLAFLACASSLLIVTASAQAIYGSIFGTVSDKSGAVIPNATITVTDVAKGTVVTVQSNGSGDYSVPHLIPDVYNLKVVAKGFTPFETTGISVLADTAPRIDPTLEVGSDTGTTVTVNAESVPQLKTDKADVATIFDSQEVANLPVPDQNFTNLQLLVPGAQKLGWSHAASENPQASQQIMVNGQAFAGTAFELDGTDNQDPILGIIVINPTMDAVTETKITTQNFDAELGKAVSAVVTAQTKSGTNSFHGSVYDFRTSNANLARDPFSQAPGTLPPGLKNRFGAAVGGRIIRDKFFFFGNYEGQRQKVGTSTTNTVPTELLMETALGNTVGPSGIPGADFSQYQTQLGDAGTIYDTSKPQFLGTDGKLHYPAFPGNVVPLSYLQRAASQPALNLFKLLEPYSKGIGLGSSGNLNGLDGNFHGSGTGGLNSDQWTERMDLTVNERMHAFERFSRFTDTLTGKTEFGAAGGRGFGIGGYAGTSKGANDSLASGMDIAVNPNLLTDFRLAYYRYNIVTSKFDQSVAAADQLGIPNLNTGDYFTGGSPGYDFATLPGGGTQPVFGSDLNVNRCNCPLTEKEDQFQIVNNWTMIRGNHTFKVGADLRYARNLRVPSDNNRTGILNANADETSDPASGTAGGLGFATWLLGDVTNFRRYVSTSTNAKEFQKRTFFYGQDTWRVNKNLTLNLGLRWELYFPESVNAKGNGSLLNLADGYLHVAGVGQVPSDMGWTFEKKSLYAPRIGLTYQVDDRTVLRAGYGRSFDIGIFGSIFGHVVTQNLPVLANQNINNKTSASSAFTLDVGPKDPTPIAVPSNGLLPNPGDQVNSRARPNPLRFPEIDAWNLAVQRALSPTLSLTLAYVGNKGTYTLGDSSGNTINPNEAAINLPGSLSVDGQSLHYDPSVAQGTIDPATGGTQTYNFLRRYYGASLPACRDAAYTTSSAVSPGQCGWTNDITYYSDNLNTNFNALQVTLQQNAWKGLNYTMNYQWASAFANATTYASWDRHPGYGRDSNVRLQQVTFYGTYELPFGKGKAFGTSANRASDMIIGGWQLSSTLNWAGGLPFTLNYNEAGTNLPGGFFNFPSYAGSGKMKSHLSGFQPKAGGTGQRTYYTRQIPCVHTGCKPGANGDLTNPQDAAAGTGVFKNPGLDTIGNVGRNTFFGPSFFNADLSIAKTVTIHENIAMKFRMDAFNGFNHINPGNPGGNIESDGTIGGAAPGALPRQLEFALRVQF
jgi:hypothetical protein